LTHPRVFDVPSRGRAPSRHDVSGYLVRERDGSRVEAKFRSGRRIRLAPPIWSTSRWSSGSP